MNTFNSEIRKIRKLSGLTEAWVDDGEPLFDLDHYTDSASGPFRSGGKIQHILAEVEEILTNSIDGLDKLVITVTPQNRR